MYDASTGWWPAQWGRHDEKGKHHSYGHSAIVDPWGVVVAECGDGEGICLAESDPEQTERMRCSMPVVEHRRL